MDQPQKTENIKRHVDMTADEIREKFQHDQNWPIQSFDAQDWAKAFCKTFHEYNRPDEATMLAWFANALMRGWDQRQWESDAAEVPDANPHVTAAADLLEVAKAAYGAVNDAFGQANAEYQGLDYLASKYDDKIRAFREKAKAAIAKAEGR